MTTKARAVEFDYDNGLEFAKRITAVMEEHDLQPADRQAAAAAMAFAICLTMYVRAMRMPDNTAQILLEYAQKCTLQATTETLSAIDEAGERKGAPVVLAKEPEQPQ